MAQSPYSTRDSNSIRASVYDVFLELGALDANSRVADWIFGDPSVDLPDPDRVASRSTRDNVRFDEEAQREQALQMSAGTEAQKRRSTGSASKPFGLKFSPKRRSSSKSKSTTSPARSPSEDGYETDEGYVSASNTPRKSRVRGVFSLQPSTRASPGVTESPTKPLPALPPIRERLSRTASSSSLAKAKSLFRKRPKSPSEGTEDDLQQWHEVYALRPRAFNPSVGNGAPLVPPTSFRQIVSPPRDAGDTSDTEPLYFALPRTIFRSISTTKRGTLRPRPRSLHLVDEPSPRATSLPSTPFIFVTESEGAGAGASTPGPQTPFVFVSAIDNPTPLNSARWSQFTSLTAPMFPLSIRRSMVLDGLEPAFPRLRPTSSYSSLQDALVASVMSPYELYNQPVPGIQRGREAPFPSRPILPQPLSHTVHAGESRLATIERYREFSEQLVELTPYKRFTNM